MAKAPMTRRRWFRRRGLLVGATILWFAWFAGITLHIYERRQQGQQIERMRVELNHLEQQLKTLKANEKKQSDEGVLPTA